MARHLYLHSAFFLGLVFPDWLAAGPIHDAAFFGKLDTIQTLLDKGPDIDERDSFDRTELHRAAGKDSPKVAEFLISKGSKLDAKDNLGWTPLFVSANAGHATTAAALLRYGSNAEASDDAGKSLCFRLPLSSITTWLNNWSSPVRTVIPDRSCKRKKPCSLPSNFGGKLS